MKVLLVDADSKIPNLALMKLSTYHKKRGDKVNFIKLDIQYYSNRNQRKIYYSEPIFHGYSKIYCSVIFDSTIKYIKSNTIIFGGSGFSLHKDLPDTIERLDPDYSIYPDNDVSYGFISRGCIRNCKFCSVPEKEGGIHQVNTVDNIVKHKKTEFLDNNILALPTHKEVLEELIQKKIYCRFTQGLDIRCIDEENSLLLRDLNYWSSYTFAFDDLRMKNLIDTKLELLEWRPPWVFRFFVYCHPSMPLSNILDRIHFLRQNECLPYIMRDRACFYTEHHRFYADIAAWCNQPHMFKTKSFEGFLNIRYNGIKSRSFSKELKKYEVNK